MGMSAEVRYQFYLFGMALLWGGGLCLAYDILRIFRRLIRHRGWMINGEDVLYWLAAAAVFYSLLFRYNQGEIRIFIVLGMIFGGVFYLLTISRVFVHLTVTLFTPLFRLFRRIRMAVFHIFRRRPSEK